MHFFHLQSTDKMLIIVPVVNPNEMYFHDLTEEEGKMKICILNFTIDFFSEMFGPEVS